MYTFNIVYNVRKGTEFSLYGENVFILIQSWILLFMFLRYDKNTSPMKLFTHIFCYLIIGLPLTTEYVPDQVFDFSIYINMTLSFKYFFFHIVLISRGPQIMLNHKNKSTGQLALISQLLSFMGSLTRAFTYLVSSSDWLYNVFFYYLS